MTGLVRRDRGFTLIELLVVIAVIALLIGLLLPALGEARGIARRVIDQNNQRQLATAMNTYSTTYEDRIVGFTWRPPQTPGGSAIYGGTDDAEIRQLMAGVGYGTMATTPAAYQAVDIMRRRTGGDQSVMPVIHNWIPHVYYTHLVLQDFLAGRLPEKLVVSPSDRHRLNWQRDAGRLFMENFWAPFQATPTGDQWRWVYSSSYQIVPAAFDYNQSMNVRQRVGMSVSTRLYQTLENYYNVTPYGRLGGLRLSDVTFPSQKVFLHDYEDRHFARENTFYAYPDARVLMATFDGSVRARRTDTTNRGWQPRSPASPQPTTFPYDPEPQRWRARLNGRDPQVAAHYRWTRGGLKGIDFGGQEIGTGQ